MTSDGSRRIDSFFAHSGIKGQKWGVRRFQNPDGTLTELGKRRYYNYEGDSPSKRMARKIKKDAKKDAKEWARAKMFYGEGAGTRRKLIKASIEQRSSDPLYFEEFNKRVLEQDMAKHASKAKHERTRKDVAKNTAKTARGIKNLVLGTGASVSLGAVIAYNAYKHRGEIKGAFGILKNKIGNIRVKDVGNSDFINAWNNRKVI